MNAATQSVKTERRPDRHIWNIFFKKSILRACFKVFWPIGLIFSVISIVVYSIEADKFSEQLSIKEHNILKLQHSALKNNLSERVKDAVFLAEIISLKKKKNKEFEELDSLINVFVKMMRNNDVYNQIRWLNNEGMELIRIDHSENGPNVVPSDQLQDKSERYYFQEGMAGPRVYISKFDLNVEHGKMELPVKPMIRITAIVQDETGGSEGLVVLNIKGREIIHNLKKIGKQMTGLLSFMNSDGYYLLSPNPDDEWAFMYPNKISRKFATTRPNLWRKIKDTDSGQFISPDGLVTFVTVDMASPRVSESGYEFHTAESWKIVSLVPTELLIPEWRNLFFYGVLSILLVTAGACFYWATARVNRAEAQKIIFENEEKFKTVTQTMEDAVIVIDEHERIQFWSDSGLRMLGYSAKEALDRSLHEIIRQGPDLSNAPQKEGNFLKKGQIAEATRIGETTAIRKDGTSLPVEISIMPLIQDGKQFAAGIIRDLSERKKAEEEKKDLLELSATDGLTGLANRRSFDEVLQDEYRRHSRSAGILSLIFIDIDHFKAFNDTYGHISGDHCLQRVAHVLAQCAYRRSDLVARYGGEEFACILPETGHHGAVVIAEKIQKNIVALAIPNKGSSVAPHVTVSIGVVTVSCTLDQSPEYVLSQVDKQLYNAKESGRNRIESVDLSGAQDDMDRNIVQLMWKNSFYCGHDLIDSQHKALFNLSNQIFSAITSSQPASEISNLFAKVIEELRQHFADEEKVMHKIGYMATAEHNREHTRLLTKAIKLQKSFETSIPNLGDALHFFVKEIAVSHIIGMDRDYFPFLSGG